MFDRFLRVPKEAWLSPLVRPPFDRVHPNTYTVLACVVGLGSAGCAAAGWFGSALLLWGLNRFLDGLDGTIARLTHRQSDLGGYLDIVLDHIVYAAIPLGLAVQQDNLATYRSLGLLLASFYVNGASWMYLAALLEKRSHGAAAAGELTTITMPTGLVEGTETILLYTLFLLLPDHTRWLFDVMTIGVAVSAVQRLVWSVRNL